MNQSRKNLLAKQKITVMIRICKPGFRFREFPGFRDFFAFPFPCFSKTKKNSRFCQLVSSRNLSHLQLFMYSINIDRVHSHCGDTILNISLQQFLNCWALMAGITSLSQFIITHCTIKSM